MSTQWKPSGIIAILFGLFTQSFVFLYVNRPRLFWLYLIISLVVGIAGMNFPSGILPTGYSIEAIYSIIIAITCASHGYWLSKRYNPETKRRWYASAPATLGLTVVMLVIIFIARATLIEPFSIPSRSMSPTLNPGDHVLVSKIGYGNYRSNGIQLFRTEPSVKPERGDIMVFQNPQTPEVEWIKRVIALPGDTVAYYDKKLFLKRACEDGSDCAKFENLASVDTGKQFPNAAGGYLNVYSQSLDKVEFNILIDPLMRDPVRLWFRQPDHDKGQWTVPQGHYFVMGDNRDNSSDSRYIGFIPQENVIGKVVLIF